MHSLNPAAVQTCRCAQGRRLVLGPEEPPQMPLLFVNRLTLERLSEGMLLVDYLGRENLTCSRSALRHY